MKVLHIAYFTFRRKLKGSITSMFILPLVLIFILGFSLKGLYAPNKFSTQNAVVYSKNSEDFTVFENYVNNHKTFSQKFKFTKAYNKEKGMRSLEEGEFGAFIDIEGSKDINLYMRQLNSLKASFYQGLLDSYRSSIDLDNINIKHVEVITKDKRPNSFEYYSVTMLVMVILYGAKYGYGIIFEDKDIENKMVSLPIKRNQVIIGKMLGIVTLIFCTSMGVIVAAKLLYNVNWGNNYLLLVLVILLYSLFSVNLGMAIGSIVKDEVITSYIIEIAIGFFTFVSGGYVTMDLLGDEINKISILSPSYAVHNIMFKNMYGYSNDVRRFFLELIILSLLTFGVTMELERRRTY